MADLSEDFAIAQTLALLTRYAFDLRGCTVEKLIDEWIENYQPNWLRLATIEALYLGRYKVVSVEQILHLWQRLGNPNCHFNHEFERLICRKLPRYLTELSEFSKQNISENINEPSTDREVTKSIELFPQSALKNNAESNSLGSETQEETETHSLSEESPESLLKTNRSNDSIDPESDRSEASNNYISRPPQQMPIDRFVPDSDRSDFSSKLRAFVDKSLEEEE
jgi:hypothetical protein